MQMPNVTHPKVFKIGALTVQLVTYMSITDEEAALLVRYLYATQPKLRSKKPQHVTIPWPGDRDALASLSAR
jgi:hypothetical protein